MFDLLGERIFGEFYSGLVRQRIVNDQLKVRRECRLTGRSVRSERMGSVKGEYESTQLTMSEQPRVWPDA
jgi:hypothetical protein